MSNKKSIMIDNMQDDLEQQRRIRAMSSSYMFKTRFDDNAEDVLTKSFIPNMRSDLKPNPT